MMLLLCFPASCTLLMEAEGAPITVSIIVPTVQLGGPGYAWEGKEYCLHAPALPLPG